MKRLLLSAYLSFVATLAVAQNDLLATPNPSSLAEAAGLYAGATAFTKTVKGSACGFAVTRDTPSLPTVIKNDIAPLFPAERRDEVYRALMSLEPDMLGQGASMYSSFYRYYTKTEGMDHRTACGFVASSAISTQKLAKEAMARMAYR
jgi:hypothetical protein